MKITNKYIILVVLFLFGIAGFAQTQKYTDEEIGFNRIKKRLTQRMQERGLTAKQIKALLVIEREMTIQQYEEMLRVDAEYQKRYEKYSQKSITNNKVTANQTNSSILANCIMDIPQAEKDALEALYANTDGSNWVNNTGWLDYNACNWFGVTVENGHVTGIDLRDNELSGILPLEFENLTQLIYLNIADYDGSNNSNNITSFNCTLSNLQHLQYISFYKNLNLVVNFQNQGFTNLDDLIVLSMYKTLVEGQFVVGDLKWSNLEMCELTSCNLNGEIIIGENCLTSITNLGLGDNQITGFIPNELANLTTLESLGIQINNLEGNIPSNLPQLVNLHTLRLNNNFLEGNIPFFNNSPSIYLFYSENKFRFIDFEAEHDYYSTNIITYIYAPQAKIDTEETISIQQGSSYTLTMFTDGNYSTNNTYQWYKGVYPNGVAISGATNRTYTLNNITQADAGDYYCLANNTIVTGLTLERNPIHLEVAGCDLDITDITYTEGDCSFGRVSSKNDSRIALPVTLCATENYCFSLNYTSENSFVETTYWTLSQNGQVISSQDGSGVFANLIFPIAGTYTVTVVASLPDGCSVKFTKTFLVEDCDPCDHVAILVDESGSIDEDEALQIRNGLNRFIEDQLDSGMTVSFIGMSDSDTDLRTDHITEQKITATTKPLFDAWVAGYGNRYDDDTLPGISASSDYWASALSVVQNLTNTPEMVIILTDGAQTANIDNLVTQIDWVRTNSHLYVYGIDGEYYVNGDNTSRARLSRDQDPNYTKQPAKTTATLNSNTVARSVVSSLFTSLDYLFGTDPVEGFPNDGIDNFSDFDYHGYDDFIGLSTGLTVLSNMLAVSDIACAVSLEECYDCFTFQPQPGNKYWVSAWAKKDLNIQKKSYYDPYDDEGVMVNDVVIELIFIDNIDQIIEAKPFYPKGDIIEGWQLIAGEFEIPAETVTMEIELINNSPNVPVYYDDIRIHPVNGSMKSFVYDPITFRLMAELDENNYATFYEYDSEGGLVRVKKETSRGVKTIQETRSGNVIKIIEE